MPSGTFVPFEVVRFPSNRKTLKTEERRPRGSDDPQADPVYTQLAFSTHKVAGNFEQAILTHRKGVYVEGFWHGTPITHIVEQKKFDAYFDVNQKILITRARKETALSAVEALNDEFKDIFQLRTIGLDFAQIIPRAVNVIGSWFKGMQFTNVRTEAAFGSGINNDPEFKRMAALGRHSNLVVVMHFGSDMFKVNLSKEGSVYFMDEHPLQTCLSFVMHLRKYRLDEQPSQKSSPKAATA